MIINDKKKGEKDRDSADGANVGVAFATFSQEMYKKQLEIFEQWNVVLKKNVPDPEESKVLTGIVTGHWKKMSDRIEEMTSESVTPGPHMVENQKKMFVEFLESYNDMLKEVMATSQFASMVGAQMSKTMDQHKQMETLRDDLIGSFGMPTRSDIRDIHESIYYLNKRFDDLERLLRKLPKDRGE